MGARDEVIAELTGPGGGFELTTATVLGEPVTVFANRMRSLRELVANTEKFGDQDFLVLDDQRLTFSDFIAQVAAAGAALRNQGVGHGDRVAIFAANCPQWVVAFFGATCIGAVVSAYNGWWTADEVNYATELSQPSLVIADTRRLERSGSGRSGAPVLVIEQDWAPFISSGAGATLDDLNGPLAEDDPAVILFTSGTTGRPKGATASHRGMIGFIQSTMLNGAVRVVAAQRAAAQPDPAPDRPAAVPGQPVTLGTSPLFHVSGLYGTTLISMVTGGKIVFRKGRFDPEAVLGLIADEEVTSIAALGNIGSQLANHPRFSEFDTSSVVNLGFGGAPASPAVQDLMRQAFPTAALSIGMGYGSSESVAVITSIGGAEFRERPTSCGQVAIGTAAEIRGADGRPVPTGTEGEIWSRSAYTMLGYWNDPEATTAALGPGRWLNTGDVGRFDEDGYLYINSRARDMILRNAENIYPIEIEYRLDAHPGVVESAVFGVDHPDMGQEVKAVVVLLEDSSVGTDDLAEWCGKTLAPFKIPTQWEIRPDPLPRNAAGKVVKRDLQP